MSYKIIKGLFERKVQMVHLQAGSESLYSDLKSKFVLFASVSGVSE